MRILMDLDSTLLDLHTPWLGEYRKMHPDDPVTMESMTDYDATACVKYPEDIYRVFDIPGFYLNLQFLPGAKEALKLLRQGGHDIFIATAPSRNPDTAADKLRWIRKHLPFIKGDHIVLGSAKYLLKADALFDDSPRVADEYRDEWGDKPWVGGIQHPYNEMHASSWDTLAESWQDPAQAWAILLADFNDYVREMA